MADSIWGTSAVGVEDDIFFMTEKDGYPGIIRVSTGELFFLPEVPREMIGRPSFEKQLFRHGDSILVFSNNGAFLYKYNLNNLSYERIFQCDDYENIKVELCAGKWQDSHKICIFTRSCYIVAWDFLDKRITKKKILENEKLIWAVGNGKDIWLLMGENFDLYKYDIYSGECRLYAKSIFKGYEIKSNSWIPIHFMTISGNSIYLHDAKNIYVFDIINKDICILYSSNSEDNGGRLVVSGDKIIIPSFYRNEIYTIDRLSGNIISKATFFEKDYNNMTKKICGATGGTCEAKSRVYLPLMLVKDAFVGIDKKTGELLFYSVKNRIRGKKEVVRNLLAKNLLIEERQYRTCSDFIEVIEE